MLYPTLGILWEAELDDVELSQAYCRAYNRWIADFCRSSSGRLIPIAHLSLGDPAAAAAELERAVKDGCRGAFVVPFTWTHKAHGDPAHDAVFAKAVELDVPIAIHPAFEPFELRSPRFENGHRLSLLASVTAGEGVRQAFTTFFDFATFDRFPKLKLVLLECGAGWIGYWLDRLDGVATATYLGGRAPLEAQAERLLPPPGLDLGRSRRAHPARHDGDLRRRPLLLGIGLSPSRPHRRLPAGAGGDGRRRARAGPRRPARRQRAAGLRLLRCRQHKPGRAIRSRQPTGRCALPPAALAELHAVLAEIRRAPLPTFLLDPADFALDACRAAMNEVRRVTRDGADVRRARPPADGGAERDEAIQLYWLLSSLLARPVAQKLNGQMFYDVMDTGAKLKPGSGIRPTVTNVDLRFHNDNSYNETPPDYVCLLCLHPA